MNREIGIELYTLLCGKLLVGTCCIALGAQLGALW